MMHNDLKKVLVSEDNINEICARLGKQISKDYEGKEPLFIGLLKGCLPFMSDLLKNVSIYCNLDYLRVSSYVNDQSTGTIKVLGELPNVSGRDVILVDDICDTGRTVNRVVDLLMNAGAKSVKVCVLLDKPAGRVEECNPEYIGQEVPKEFVVGYGLDYNERYRNLAYIGVLKEEIYKK